MTDVEQPLDDDDFVPSASFAGSRPGYVFRDGARGSGYYRDDGGNDQPVEEPPPQKNNDEEPPALKQEEDKERAAAAARLSRGLANSCCVLRPSPLHGVGVFAAVPIERGRIITFPNPPMARVAESALGQVPPPVQELLARVYPTGEEGMRRVPLDGLHAVSLECYLNHLNGERAALEWVESQRHYVARRTVPAGTELTVDYRQRGWLDTYLPSKRERRGRKQRRRGR